MHVCIYVYFAGGAANAITCASLQIHVQLVCKRTHARIVARREAASSLFGGPTKPPSPLSQWKLRSFTLSTVNVLIFPKDCACDERPHTPSSHGAALAILTFAMFIFCRFASAKGQCFFEECFFSVDSFVCKYERVRRSRGGLSN